MQESILNLVELCKQDPSYMYELWERFRPLCVTWARKLRNAEDEEGDLLQESYILLVKGLSTYENEKEVAFEAYYKYILYRWGRNYKRKKNISCIYDGEDYNLLEQLIDEKTNVEAEAIRNEQRGKLHQALTRLNKEEYELVKALYVDEAKLSEIARSKQMTYKAISHKKYKLLKKIKKFLGEL